MELLLVRHAIAEVAQRGQPDFDRALSTDGARRFAEVVSGLAGVGVKLDRIVSSPLVRAIQTAELMDGLLKRGGERVESALMAEPPDGALLSEIDTEDDSCVALVGHEPWMSTLCAWLVTGRADPALNLPFKKGGVAWLVGQPRPMGATLRAFLPPRITRHLD